VLETPASFISDLEKCSESDEKDTFSLRGQVTLGFLEKFGVSKASTPKMTPVQRPSAVLDIHNSRRYPPSFVLDIRAPSNRTVNSGILYPRIDQVASARLSETLYSFLDFESPTLVYRSLSISQSLISPNLDQSQSPSSPATDMPSLPTPVMYADYTLPPVSPVSTFGLITRQSSFKSLCTTRRKSSIRRLSSVPTCRGVMSHWSLDSSCTSFASNRGTYASTCWEDEDAPPLPVRDLKDAFKEVITKPNTPTENLPMI
jgi:hypothetical protein